LICNWIILWIDLNESSAEEAWKTMFGICCIWSLALFLFIGIQSAYYLGQLEHLTKTSCGKKDPGHDEEMEIKKVTNQIKETLMKIRNTKIQEIVKQFHDDG